MGQNNLLKYNLYLFSHPVQKPITKSCLRSSGSPEGKSRLEPAVPSVFGQKHKPFGAHLGWLCWEWGGRRRPPLKKMKRRKDYPGGNGGEAVDVSKEARGRQREGTKCHRTSAGGTHGLSRCMFPRPPQRMKDQG